MQKKGHRSLGMAALNAPLLALMQISLLGVKGAGEIWVMDTAIGRHVEGDNI